MQNKNPRYLPIDGLSRESELLPFLPFGKSTLWQWSKDGRFPKPIKLADKVTAWDNEQVHEWLNSFKNKNKIEDANDDE